MAGEAKLTAGDSWELGFKFPAGYGLADVAARGQLRPCLAVDSVALACTTTNGMLVVDAASGMVWLRCPKEATGLPAGRYYFQLELTWTDGRRQSLPNLTITVAEDLTR